jgi:hypothetical protein
MARSPLLRPLVRLSRATGANVLLNRAVNHMPPSWQRLAARASIRDELVPADRLRQSYVGALRLLLEDAPAGDLGDYLEFGVYQGTSMGCMVEAMAELGVTSARLVGFDSFEGMPAESSGQDNDVWRPGEFRASLSYARSHLTVKGADWDRTFLVKGWFDETLVPQTRAELNVTRASVVMVDCDLYSSTALALDFCLPLFTDHTIVFFDDWHSGRLADQHLGERRAFDEFLARYPHLVAEPRPELCYVDASMVFSVRPHG